MLSLALIAHLPIRGEDGKLQGGTTLEVTTAQVRTAQRQLHCSVQMPAEHRQHDWSETSGIASIDIGPAGE